MVTNVAVTKSILNSVKKAIDGMDEEIHDFDDELVIYINSTLQILYQLGVGTPGFFITGAEETWDDFLKDQEPDVIGMIQQYVALKIKYIWDPPVTGAATTALKEMIQELEFRLNIQADPGDFP